MRHFVNKSAPVIETSMGFIIREFGQNIIQILESQTETEIFILTRVLTVLTIN